MSGPEKLKQRRIQKTTRASRRPPPREDSVAGGLKGRWWAEVKDTEGNVRVIKPDHNLIVFNAKILAAALFKGDPSFPSGILYHAIGSGDPNWDTLGTPDPSFVQTTLMTEEFRKAPTEIVYIDGVGDPTFTPTNIIRIKTVFETTDADPGGVQVREHGLFGGDATGVADSGLMIDVIHVSSIFKDNTLALTIYIELEF